jgi:hypothetical protein
MSGSLARRLSGVLLTVVLLGGGFGLPALDALLYHSGQQSAGANVAHFDPPGGCGAHAEHCVLLLTLSLRQLGGPAFSEVRLTHLLTETGVYLAVPALRVTDPTYQHRSRAPPFAAF